jgi:hypothetical protein
MERLGISQVGRWRVELRNEGRSIGSELWRLVQIPIDPMTVMTDALSIKDDPAGFGVAHIPNSLSCFLRLLGGHRPVHDQQAGYQAHEGRHNEQRPDMESAV